MSEQPTETHAPFDAPVEQTGNPDVDAVVASLEDLADRPVSEHVALFESAHDRLRGALADAGNEPAPDRTGA